MSNTIRTRRLVVTLRCADCGRRMNADTVNMLDQCLGCGAEPFPAVQTDTEGALR